MERHQISVIIPTLNEAKAIERTIRSLADEPMVEIIVADGGSQDDTVQIAQKTAIVVSGPPGRSNQQNAGAGAASGEILLFLHADCRLEPGWSDDVRQTMSNGKSIAGCFRFRIDGVRLAYRVIEWGVRQRVRWCSAPYGDQGLFLLRSTFDQVGGFPQVPLMEDLLLVRHLRRIGPITMLQRTIWVSARRWEQRGAIRQTIRNWSLVCSLWCGVSPDQLAPRYPHTR